MQALVWILGLRGIRNKVICILLDICFVVFHVAVVNLVFTQSEATTTTRSRSMH